MVVIVLLLIFGAVTLFFMLAYQMSRVSYKKYEERYLASAAKELDEMFVFIPPERLIHLNFISTFVVGALGFMITLKAPFPVPIIATVVFGFIGYLIPKFVLRQLIKRRLNKFGEQLVDALSMIANSLKSGFSFLQAMELLVKEMPNPLSQEFGLVLQENRLGMKIEDALNNMSARLKLEDLDLVITSVIITRQVGGNLSEIFDRIAHTIRKRHELQGKIRSLTAQGKLQGIVVGLLPVGLGLALYKIDPNMMKPMFTTLFGWLGIVAILILEVCGALFIKKIVTIDV